MRAVSAVGIGTQGEARDDLVPLGRRTNGYQCPAACPSMFRPRVLICTGLWVYGPTTPSYLSPPPTCTHKCSLSNPQLTPGDLAVLGGCIQGRDLQRFWQPAGSELSSPVERSRLAVRSAGVHVCSAGPRAGRLARDAERDRIAGPAGGRPLMLTGFPSWNSHKTYSYIMVLRWLMCLSFSLHHKILQVRVHVQFISGVPGSGMQSTQLSAGWMMPICGHYKWGLCAPYKIVFSGWRKCF